ncbi:MAG: hypothetical protein K2Y37_10440 [Pirellulales bacterium]|nr:hypothetical protein [Pirellulales bacterium]
MKIEEFPPDQHEQPIADAPQPHAQPAPVNRRWRRGLARLFFALAMLVLSAAAVVGVVGVIANSNQERAYSTNADVARQRMGETISIELPDEFRPECSSEMHGLLGLERTSIWSMYEWQGSDSFVLAARSTKDVTKAPLADPPRDSDSVDLLHFVQDLLFNRGRIFEPLRFGEPEQLDDRNPDGSLTEPRNSTELLNPQEADRKLRKDRAKFEEVETIELLGQKVKVWVASGTGAVNDEPYWQVLAGIPTPDGSILFALQAKKSELSRDEIEAIVRSIREPTSASANSG